MGHFVLFAIGKAGRCSVTYWCCRGVGERIPGRRYNPLESKPETLNPWSHSSTLLQAPVGCLGALEAQELMRTEP